jgi:hypothetical protein
MDVCAIIKHKLNNTAKEQKMQAVTLNTNGQGYWSRVAKAVRIVDMQVTYVNDEKDFGELCVYFNTEDWDVNRDGLIYTDKQFRDELQAFLDAQGLPGKDISYSEQGMQGDNYVSMDIVSAKFLQAWESI